MQTNNKLREALCEILSYIEAFHKYIVPRKGEKTTALFAVADTIRDKAKAALAEPVKNCEVGTAEEQSARMRAFCVKNGLCRDGAYRCENCGLLHEFRCELTWAQMPYEEGGAK